jgi:hypothetical protein
VNFLQLCTAAASDSGTIAGLPSFTTVAGATGRVAKLVGWVRDAYIDIQNERTDWLWMRKDFSHALTIGQREYTPAQLGISDFGKFLTDTPEQRVMSIYDPAQGQGQESHIQQVPWQWYRQTYDFGSHDAQQPSVWTQRGSNLWVGPTPDKAYILRGEYRATAQVLASDTDVPEMPERFHRLIVAEAIRLMARSDEAFQVIVERSEQYLRLRNPLVIDQTPEASIAEEPFA